ncbi:MAG TPA: YceI family protein [Candidatus Limnocylindria bacterium]|nr:YceI family protein [Candidatus Limnocylindria bacterium]
MKKVFLIAIIAALVGVPAFAQTGAWQIDPAHSNAQFLVRHMGISNVQGDFTKVSGSVQLDDSDITKSAVSATIDVNSVDTREPNRDKDLRGATFFDVTKFPTMAFQSKKFVRSAEGKLKMTGDLTIHGVTREVTFDVDGPTPTIQDPWGNARRGVSATTKINRKDFGLNFNAALGTGEMVVGDTVTITLDVEIVKKS